MPWNDPNMDKNWDVIGATAFDQSFNMVQDGSHRLPTPIIKEMASMALKGGKLILQPVIVMVDALIN